VCTEIGELLHQKFSLNNSNSSDYWICVTMLGSVQEGTDICVTSGAMERGLICISYGRIELVNIDVPQKHITHMCCIYSVLWRAGWGGYRGQIVTALLYEQGRS
jgi:hypothetical protein